MTAAARVATLLLITCAGCGRGRATHPGGPGHDDPATATVKPVTPVDVDTARAAVIRGRQLFAAHDFAGARAAFAQAVLKNPQNADAFFWSGRAYVVTASGMSYSRALEFFAHALALDPQLVEAHWGLGLAHYNLAQIEDAQREFTDFLAAASDAEPAPMRAEAHHFLGVIAGSTGDVEKALAEFAAAEQLNPAWADVAFERGKVLETAGRIDEAIASFQAATQREPNHLPAHFRLSLLLRTQGREADAEREKKIHRVLNDLFDNSTGRETKAPEKRLELYGELAGLDPSNHTARLEYARALIELGRATEAELALDDLMRDAPAFGDAYIVRARLALDGGHKERAAQVIAALEKNVPTALANLPESLKSLLPPR
jgi:tetratricopeptide (TPR) repeat protein